MLVLEVHCSWQIENQLYWVKDVTLGEGQSTVRAGNGPTVMALLCAAALSLLHEASIHQLAACLRAHGQDTAAAVALDITALPAPTRA